MACSLVLEPPHRSLRAALLSWHQRDWSNSLGASPLLPLFTASVSRCMESSVRGNHELGIVSPSGHWYRGASRLCPLCYYRERATPQRDGLPHSYHSERQHH